MNKYYDLDELNKLIKTIHMFNIVAPKYYGIYMKGFKMKS